MDGSAGTLPENLLFFGQQTFTYTDPVTEIGTQPERRKSFYRSRAAAHG